MKRMLAGLVLRWLWILETDSRLLNDAIALAGHDSREVGL